MNTKPVFTKVILFFLIALFFNSKLLAQEHKPSPKTIPPQIISLTYYFDTRDYNTLKINTSGNLPYGFHLFGFVDIHSEQNNPKERFDLTRYFFEYRLSYSINPDWIFSLSGLRLNIEYNDANSLENNVIRAGLSYRKHLQFLNRSWIELRYFPYESDNSGTQVCISALIRLSKKIYINGFADMNIDRDAKNRWITKPQINFALNKTFELAFKYRYNGYQEEKPGLDGSGFAFGLRLKL